MKYKDYYAVLGVEKTATQDEIKRSYRKLARKYHPDVNKGEGAEDKFKEIGEANDVLSDIEKRAAYNQVGQGYQPGQDFTPPPNWSAGFEFTGAGPSQQAEGFSSFFEAMFGGARTPRGHREQTQFNARGEDHHARVLIELEDAINGGTQMIVLKAPELGPDGRVYLKERKLKVKIPKGIQEGKHIRLKGQGMPGIGQGSAGDLYLEITFNPHALYRVDGKDIYLDLPITLWEAALGGSVKAPTPKGSVDLKTPANSKQGKKMRLKGRGLPANSPGDLFILLNIVNPEAKTAKEKAIFQSMAETFTFNPRANLYRLSR